MRSGWPHTQEDPGSLASRQQARYGPMISWPDGYPALGDGDDDYRYPTHGTDPYAADPPVAPGPVAPVASPAPASPAGEHPYAAFGYGDPGYASPGYDGPAAHDAGPAPSPDGRSTDIYHQPWDYDQPLRYDNEEPAYPLLDSRGETAYQPTAFDPADYNGSDFSVPGVAGPGYDLSGIIGTGEFPDIGYDQPGYNRLSYDDPRYADVRPDDAPRDGTRFDLPVLEEPPRDSTRFDLPAVDDFDASRLDHVWPAREELPGFGEDFPGGPLNGSLSQTSLDLGGGQVPMNQTRFDLPAVDDYQYGFARTSADGMPALAPEAEFRPVGAGLVAPADEQPVSWADEMSFDRFDAAPALDAYEVPAAFGPPAEGAPLQTGPDTAARRAATGRRRGHSRDKREWVALGAIAVVAAGAIGGVLMKFVFSGQSGPTHTVSTPNSAAGFTREPGLEKQMKVDQLRDSVIQSSGGKASAVVSGVYQQGSSAVGSNPQIYMFVGGKLANSDPQASVSNFEQTYKQGGAHVTPAGALGGEAACATSTVNGESVSMCVWFDNDTFGEFVSPTMTPTKLAATMGTARPNLEHLAH